MVSADYLRKDSMNSARGISRRAFQRHVVSAVIAASLTGGRSRLAAQSAAAKQFPAGDYVDMHTHLGQTWNTTEPLTAEELLRWMDAHNIAQAVVLPLMSPESSSYLSRPISCWSRRSRIAIG